MNEDNNNFFDEYNEEDLDIENMNWFILSDVF